MTLKEFLIANGIEMDRRRRYKLGKRIGSQYAAIYGKCKTTIEEDGFSANDYPTAYFDSGKPVKIIMQFIKYFYENKK